MEYGGILILFWRPSILAMIDHYYSSRKYSAEVVSCYLGQSMKIIGEKRLFRYMPRTSVAQLVSTTTDEVKIPKLEKTSWVCYLNKGRIPMKHTWKAIRGCCCCCCCCSCCTPTRLMEERVKQVEVLSCMIRFCNDNGHCALDHLKIETRRSDKSSLSGGWMTTEFSKSCLSTVSFLRLNTFGGIFRALKKAAKMGSIRITRECALLC